MSPTGARSQAQLCELPVSVLLTPQTCAAFEKVNDDAISRLAAGVYGGLPVRSARIRALLPRSRLPEVVDDQDVAVPVVDVAGQCPSTVARHGQKTDGSERTHDEPEFSKSADAVVFEIVDLHASRGTDRIHGSGSTRNGKKHDAGLGHLPRAGHDRDIHRLRRASASGNPFEPGDGAQAER